MNNGLRTNKGFTLIELVVAVAVLTMVIGFSSLIFKVSIGAHRTTGANAEIMQKLRAVTDQLNADFKGLRKDAPVAITFDLTGTAPPDWVRADSIAFFANGDFQSTRQYDGRTVVGNVASIYYGQSASPDPNLTTLEDRREKILLRRQTILTAEPPLPDPNFDDEYYDKSLSQWMVEPPSSFDPDWTEWTERPDFDTDNFEEDLVMYMAEGVDDFTIQVADWNDTDGRFDWVPTNENIDDDPNEWENIPVPRAFRFTFTLYDSRGIIENGREFTHIVYVGND